MIITSDLAWNEHVNETVKKASKRLYFLVQLKRARLPCRDLVLFYVTCIRSILVYAAPVFFYALPIAKYLRCELSMERVQKGHCHSFVSACLMTRCLRNLASIPNIVSYCEDICDMVFNASAASITNMTSY